MPCFPLLIWHGLVLFAVYFLLHDQTLPLLSRQIFCDVGAPATVLPVVLAPTQDPTFHSGARVGQGVVQRSPRFETVQVSLVLQNHQRLDHLLPVVRLQHLVLAEEVAVVLHTEIMIQEKVEEEPEVYSSEIILQYLLVLMNVV